MEALLSRQVMAKGEEAAQFVKEEGVNMDGQTMKNYKEKKGLQKMILFLRQKTIYELTTCLQ